MSKYNLREYSQRFNELKTVFNSLPDGVVAILDKDSIVIAANDAISNLLNLSNNEIIGKSLTTILKKKSPALNDVLVETFIKKKEIRNFTIDYEDEQGQTKYYLVSTAFIKEVSKGETGLVLILHDISEITKLRKMASQVKRYGEIIGNNDQMRAIYTLVDTIKDYDTSVLIFGETGTGKELLARAIHESSKRKDKPFIPVNCSALPFNLIESELFGHVKGAFTGAISNRPGRFQLANGGTIFLDEIGTLNLDLQVKLLRVIQNKIIEPLGSAKPISVDIRIISATNRDLFELVEKREFREDLLYRIKVIQLTLPPLRNRSDDIPLLVNHFIERLNHYYNMNVLGISQTALEALKKYPFPGNVRELENAIEHAFVLTTGALIELHTLPLEIQQYKYEGKILPPINRNLNQDEESIRRSLLASDGNIEKASELLKIHRTTLWRKMKEFNIDKGFGKRKLS
jgi:PAS domain S-box-containing protein